MGEFNEGAKPQNPSIEGPFSAAQVEDSRQTDQELSPFELQTFILQELRKTNWLLRIGFGINDEDVPTDTDAKVI